MMVTKRTSFDEVYIRAALKPFIMPTLQIGKVCKQCAGFKFVQVVVLVVVVMAVLVVAVSTKNIGTLDL